MSIVSRRQTFVVASSLSIAAISVCAFVAARPLYRQLTPIRVVAHLHSFAAKIVGSFV